MAFSILIGPFVVMGSFLIATNKGGIAINELAKCSNVIAGVIACLCYLGLGYYGAQIDKHVITQCNKWRRLVYKLQEDYSIKEDDLIFVHNNLTLAYIVGLSLVLGAFISTSFIFFSLLTKSG